MTITKDEKKKLDEIALRPGFIALDQLERALVRKSSYLIKDNKKLLVKMLKSVNWNNTE